MAFALVFEDDGERCALFDDGQMVRRCRIDEMIEVLCEEFDVEMFTTVSTRDMKVLPPNLTPVV